MTTHTVEFETRQSPGLVDTIEGSDFNPELQLYGVFQDKGYSLRFAERKEDSPIGRKLIDVWCDDCTQRANIELRAGIIRVLPDFRFLHAVYNVAIFPDVVEKVARGETMDSGVQQIIPGAEHITFSEQEKMQALALAYSISEQGLEGWGPLYRDEIGEFRGVKLIGDESRRQKRRTDHEDRLAEVRRKKAELGVEPLSAPSIRGLVTSLYDRVEALLMGQP